MTAKKNQLPLPNVLPLPKRRGQNIEAVKRKQNLRLQGKSLLRFGLDLAFKLKSVHVFVYADAFEESMLPEKLLPGVSLILVTKNETYSYAGPHQNIQVIKIPKLSLGRMGLIKVSVLLALSAGMVKQDDTLVFVLGKAKQAKIDTLMCFKVSEETELFTGLGLLDLPQDILPAVFEHTLSLAIELGNKGKEGKAVGTIFVLGDTEKVMQLSRQMIMNPFKGYDASERNILSSHLKETLRELSTIDGAFIMDGHGEIVSAGRYLGASMEAPETPRGLGSRHLAASGITSLTNALAIVISESSGDVRIFRHGQIVMAIEKPVHQN